MSTDRNPETDWIDRNPQPRLAYSDVPTDYQTLATGGTVPLTDQPGSGTNTFTPAPHQPAPHPIEVSATTSGPALRFSPGVKLGPFVGSAVMTAVIAGLAAWLGVFILNRLTETAVPADYWVRHGVTPTILSTSTAVTLAAASAIAGAGAMWLLLMITAQAQTFFSSIAGLVGAIATVVTFAAHPWQESLGPAALIAVIACVIATLTPQYARLTTSPERI